TGSRRRYRTGRRRSPRGLPLLRGGIGLRRPLPRRARQLWRQGPAIVRARYLPAIIRSLVAEAGKARRRDRSWLHSWASTEEFLVNSSGYVACRIDIHVAFRAPGDHGNDHVAAPE